MGRPSTERGILLKKVIEGRIEENMGRKRQKMLDMLGWTRFPGSEADK